MRNQTMQDERVSAQRLKINSDAFGILMIALLASILIQQYPLNAPFEQYAVECICFFGMSIYMTVRYIALGLSIYGEGTRAKGVLFLTSIVSGTVATAVNGVLNYAKYADRYRADGIGYFVAVLAITFFSAAGFVYVILSLVACLTRKRQSNIQRRLDEDEQGG